MYFAHQAQAGSMTGAVIGMQGPHAVIFCVDVHLTGQGFLGLLPCSSHRCGWGGGGGGRGGLAGAC